MMKNVHIVIEEFMFSERLVEVGLLNCFSVEKFRIKEAN